MRIYKTVCYEICYEISVYFIWIAQYHTKDYTYRVQRASQAQKHIRN